MDHWASMISLKVMTSIQTYDGIGQGSARVTAFLLVFIILLSSCDKTPESGGNTAALPEYSAIEIVPRHIEVFTEYPATIRGQQNVEIRPKVDGYVEAMYVDEGAAVKRGQRLFKISAPQYEQEVRTAEAAIKIAEADVLAAETEVERVRPLVERNIISKYQLETAEYNLQSKRAALAQAQARLQNARVNLGYTLISSPVHGVVGDLPFKIGSLVSSSTTTPLTTVSDISKVYAYFSINEKQFLAYRRNTTGASQEERIRALPPVKLLLADGSEFPTTGKIEAGSGIINTQTGSLSIRATFVNPDNLVRSGSTGIVKVPETLDSALIIPQSATYELQGKRFAYVVQANGTVQNRSITISETGNGLFFIVTEGLKAGDKVVVEGITRLRDGMQIKPKVINADSLLQTLK
jgi:membrane fusion protein, multidrug efflux system